jgi:hypothetical protein
MSIVYHCQLKLKWEGGSRPLRCPILCYAHACAISYFMSQLHISNFMHNLALKTISAAGD